MTVFLYTLLVFLTTTFLGYGVVFSFYKLSPLCLKEISSFGALGDAFAGLSAIVLGAGAIAATFAAFYIQYKANKDMLRNNDKMQAERQFYEMLKIHRDNVEKMGFDYYGQPEERLHYKSNNEMVGFDKIGVIICVKGQKALKAYLDEFKVIYQGLEGEYGNVFSYAYRIFFEGIDFCQRENEISIQLFRKMLFLQATIQKTQKIFFFHKPSLIKENPFENKQCLLMQGHRDVLNSYYRHLYLTVKSVVNSMYFSEPEKKNYLKILRAQMTSEEQALLLFNWHSGYGFEWESKNGNRFFSKYKMIHNIDMKDVEFALRETDIYNEMPYLTRDERKNFFEFNQRKNKDVKN